jgi:putative transposase
MKKFLDTYRIDSARAEWWDYTQNGRYFVTICTEHHEHYFGKVRNGIMRLSQVGVIADIMWYEIKNHNKFVELGVYQVMPNHVHGILHLNYPYGYPTTGTTVDIKTSLGINPDHQEREGNDDQKREGNVETLHATSLQPPKSSTHNSKSTKNLQMSLISPKPQSLSTILRSYKAAVTKHARRLGFPCGWQGRFYDHIIRNDEEYQRIVDYIVNNPKNWKDDEFFS